MKPTLDRHEIIIVHHYGHDVSFAHVPQNKVAFSARGWNPMNRNILLLPEVIGKIINNDREKDAMMGYNSRSGQSEFRNLTKNTPTYDVKFSAPPVMEIDLNFGTGTAGSMLESIVAHSDIARPR